MACCVVAPMFCGGVGSLLCPVEGFERCCEGVPQSTVSSRGVLVCDAIVETGGPLVSFFLVSVCSEVMHLWCNGHYGDKCVIAVRLITCESICDPSQRGRRPEFQGLCLNSPRLGVSHLGSYKLACSADSQKDVT